VANAERPHGRCPVDDAHGQSRPAEPPLEPHAIAGHLEPRDPSRVAATGGIGKARRPADEERQERLAEGLLSDARS
jgi:hypothetical protein